MEAISLNMPEYAPACKLPDAASNLDVLDSGSCRRELESRLLYRDKRLEILYVKDADAAKGRRCEAILPDSPHLGGRGAAGLVAIGQDEKDRRIGRMQCYSGPSDLRYTGLRLFRCGLFVFTGRVSEFRDKAGESGRYYALL